MSRATSVLKSIGATVAASITVRYVTPFAAPAFLKNSIGAANFGRFAGFVVAAVGLRYSYQLACAYRQAFDHFDQGKNLDQLHSSLSNEQQQQVKPLKEAYQNAWNKHCECFEELQKVRVKYQLCLALGELQQKQANNLEDAQATLEQLKAAIKEQRIKNPNIAIKGTNMENVSLHVRIYRPLTEEAPNLEYVWMPINQTILQASIDDLKQLEESHLESLQAKYSEEIQALQQNALTLQQKTEQASQLYWEAITSKLVRNWWLRDSRVLA